MKLQHASKFAAVLSAIVLVSVGAAVCWDQKVSAAAEGKITGTIKLDGTAPRQRPIDMSKEPSCAKIHESNPVHTENVVVGANGGLQNVVVYISEGLTGNEASAVSSENPTWDQKGCQYIPHVLALESESALQGHQQRSDVPQHSPHAEAGRTQS